MGLSKAVLAFYHHLVHEPCDHARAGLSKGKAFCPDCGYRVKLLWMQVKCRQCDSRRIPRKMFDGAIEPLHKYCRHCGSSEVRLVKKLKIDAHEVNYSVAVKETDYSEEPRPQAPGSFHPDPDFYPQFKGVNTRSRNQRPYSGPSLDIVEGEVIRKRYVG